MVGLLIERVGRAAILKRANPTWLDTASPPATVKMGRLLPGQAPRRTIDLELACQLADALKVKLSMLCDDVGYAFTPRSTTVRGSDGSLSNS